MQQVISERRRHSSAVELDRAKQRIAEGRTRAARPRSTGCRRTCRRLGQQAAADFTDKFDELTESVNDKGAGAGPDPGHEVHRGARPVDEEIAAEKEKNKGLIAKAVDAVGGVIKTILELKNLLLGVLAKAASAVGPIIKDPIGFLGNLVSAVGAGLKRVPRQHRRAPEEGLESAGCWARCRGGHCSCRRSSTCGASSG